MQAPCTRTLWIALAAALLSSVISGCATPPPAPPGPTTTVVLLPDEEGRVGAVSVASAGGAQTIDSAFTSVEVRATGAPPSSPQQRGSASVESSFAQLLAAQPAKPLAFILNFKLDSSALTDESRLRLPTLLQAARQRKPTEITVFGHADAIGPERRNLELSAQRAQVVAELLRKSDPDAGTIAVQSFGDKVPLVPEKPGVPEPRNRRVEVQIL